METAVANVHALQVAATTGNGVVVDMMGVNRELTLYVKGTGGVTAGKIKLETADDVAYAGTWALLGSEITISPLAMLVTQITGCFKAIRARISVNVVGTSGTATGGSVSTVVKAAAGWTTNLYAGCTVTMLTGTPANINQTRTIVSNNSTTLNVTPDFPAAVANLDTFVISGDVTVTLEAN